LDFLLIFVVQIWQNMSLVSLYLHMRHYLASICERCAHSYMTISPVKIGKLTLHVKYSS